MTKVLHVFKIYYPEIFGGVQRVIHDLANGAADYGIRSTVFALSQTPHSDPVTVGKHQAITAKQQLYIASTGLSLSAFSSFGRCVKNADIIHYHYPWPFMDLLHISARVKKPTILTYHSDIVRQKGLMKYYRPLMRYFLNDMDRLIATSPNYLKTSPVLEQYRDKTEVIPIGIASDEIVVDINLSKAWRAKLGQGFFLFMGALRSYKGLHLLMKAAEQTKLPIVIAGTGELEPELRAIAPDNVTFTGHYTDEDRAALLSLASAFVFPSHQRSEAFGVSLLEAARMSVPMICCELGTGTSFVNIDGQTGRVIEPNNLGALCNAMIELASNKDRAAQFGHAARQRFLQKFTQDQMVQSYVAQYSALMKHQN